MKLTGEEMTGEIDWGGNDGARRAKGEKQRPRGGEGEEGATARARKGGAYSRRYDAPLHLLLLTMGFAFWLRE